MKKLLVRDMRAFPELLEGKNPDTGATQKLIGVAVTASESGKEAEQFILAFPLSSLAAIVQNLQSAMSALGGTPPPDQRH